MLCSWNLCALYLYINEVAQTLFLFVPPVIDRYLPWNCASEAVISPGVVRHRFAVILHTRV
jgi:hypothetical protein